MKKKSISQKTRFVGVQIITILTLKTGLLTMFFTEKRYRSINTGSTNKNTINITPLRVCSISELRCLCRNLLFGTKRETVDCCCPSDPCCCSLHCLRYHSSALISRPFWIERKLALTCLNTQTTLQYKHQKRATILIVTILFDINACNNKISINNKREGRITSRLGLDFY